MIVGIDFDNTIVDYDAAFHSAALSQGLIPSTVPRSKQHVRDYLRNAGCEDAWTELQGYVYGARMAEATPFPGVDHFFRRCRMAGVRTLIISHKTRHPYAGPRYDLHAAARDWLARQGFFSPGTGLEQADVYFELTKEAKLRRIAASGSTYFIDDLPEFLAEEGFAVGVQRVLFDPHRVHDSDVRWRIATSWEEIGDLVLRAAPDQGRRTQ